MTDMPKQDLIERIDRVYYAFISQYRIDPNALLLSPRDFYILGSDPRTRWIIGVDEARTSYRGLTVLRVLATIDPCVALVEPSI